MRVENSIGVKFGLNRKECPRQDSNLHKIALTTPSRWRVYQFHHLGLRLLLLSGRKGTVGFDNFQINRVFFCFF